METGCGGAVVGVRGGVGVGGSGCGEEEKAPDALVAAGGDDAGGGVGVGRHAEEPGGHAELGVAGVERVDSRRRPALRAACGQDARVPRGGGCRGGGPGGVQAVEVPPAAAVGDEGEPAVGVEAGLLDCLGRGGVAAGDEAWGNRAPAFVEVGEPEFGGVPGHVGVVPAQPGELRAVGREPGTAVEVGAGDEFGGGRRVGRGGRGRVRRGRR